MTCVYKGKLTASELGYAKREVSCDVSRTAHGLISGPARKAETARLIH